MCTNDEFVPDSVVIPLPDVNLSDFDNDFFDFLLEGTDFMGDMVSG